VQPVRKKMIRRKKCQCLEKFTRFFPSKAMDLPCE